jgi:hypothetical protein
MPEIPFAAIVKDDQTKFMNVTGKMKNSLIQESQDETEFQLVMILKCYKSMCDE